MKNNGDMHACEAFQRQEAIWLKQTLCAGKKQEMRLEKAAGTKPWQVLDYEIFTLGDSVFQVYSGAAASMLYFMKINLPLAAG